MAEDPKEYSEKEQWDDDLDVAPLNYVKPKVQKPILEKAEFDKKKKRIWVPILSIIGLLLICSIILFIYRKSIFDTPQEQLSQQSVTSTDSPQSESNKNSEEEEIQILEDDPLMNAYVEDSITIQSIENEIINETNLTNPEPDLIEGSKNFHIVIGSFEQEPNAYSFASNREELSENIQVIKFNGFFRVSYDHYANNDEAEIQLDYIRSSLNILAWIAYMK